MRKSVVIFLGSAVLAAVAGCNVHSNVTVVDQRPVYTEPVYVAQPVIVEASTVPPPPLVTEYIFIGGGYYYYHPERHVYVHVAAPVHGVTVHEYSSWQEHPMYTHVEHVAPPPHVVVAPTPVYSSQPVILEAAVVVPPRTITEYVHISGAYYYYHPERHVYVHVVAVPRGVAVREIHAWSEHPMYDKAEHLPPPQPIHH